MKSWFLVRTFLNFWLPFFIFPIRFETLLEEYLVGIGYSSGLYFQRLFSLHHGESHCPGYTSRLISTVSGWSLHFFSLCWCMMFVLFENKILQWTKLSEKLIWNKHSSYDISTRFYDMIVMGWCLDTTRSKTVHIIWHQRVIY